MSANAGVALAPASPKSAQNQHRAWEFTRARFSTLNKAKAGAFPALGPNTGLLAQQFLATE